MAWTWPRASAIGIGAVSTVWLVLQVVDWQQVAPDLARCHDPVHADRRDECVPLAGVVGLVGVLRGASGRIASGALAGAAALLGIALLASTISAAVA